MKYRKKPVVIEAEQFDIDQVPWPDGVVDMHGTATITTSEGVMRVNHGDWVITGVKGEKYPCKSDIFELTYEPVHTPAAEVAQP